MSDVKNITSKILKDAEVERDSILAASEDEKNKIISKRVNSAKALEDEILSKAEQEGKSKKDRIISSAKLKVRNDKLAQKQSVIDNVFDEALNKLCTLSADELSNFIRRSILSMDIEGDENLVLNHEGLKVIGLEFMDSLNAELKDKGLKGEIRLLKKEGSFRGGFILEKNGIEINNTYEALISSLRDELEFEVAKVLFS